MSGRRVLIAGLGNVFFGDDGFGVEVARRLRRRRQPDGVHVAEFGIRGLDLAYALLDGYAAAVLVDAAPRGGRPGTLYVLEPEVPPSATPALTDTHGLEPVKILGWLRGIGDHVPVLRIVGCEPATGSDEAMAMGLSAPVAAAVDEAVALVEALVSELREEVGLRA